MIINTYRILKKEYAIVNQLGEGAQKYGGRWNSKGTALIYTAQSLALANLEMITGSLIYPVDVFVYLEFEFEIKLVKEIPKNILPKNWNVFPYETTSQEFGDNWVNGNSELVLKVPSSLIDGEYNYLINPNHKEFKNISISSPKKMIFNNRFIAK